MSDYEFFKKDSAPSSELDLKLMQTARTSTYANRPHTYTGYV